MVRANVDISDKTNRILNIVKAQKGLKDKNTTINFIVEQYAELTSPVELKGD
jgi:hypothetical protein